MQASEGTAVKNVEVVITVPLVVQKEMKSNAAKYGLTVDMYLLLLHEHRMRGEVAKGSLDAMAGVRS